MLTQRVTRPAESDLIPSSLHVSLRVALRTAPLCCTRLIQWLGSRGWTGLTQARLQEFVATDVRYAFDHLSMIGHGEGCAGNNECTAPAVLLTSELDHWRALLGALKTWVDGGPRGDVGGSEDEKLAFWRDLGLPPDVVAALLSTARADERASALLAELAARSSRDLPLLATPPTAVLLGPSGAGKSTLMRCLLGTKDHGFPATSPSRTTTTLTTVTVDPAEGNYAAKAVFHDQGVIHKYLQDNVQAAAEARMANRNEREVKSLLLNHASLNLRLGYLVDDEVCQTWMRSLTGPDSTGVADRMMRYLIFRAHELGGGHIKGTVGDWPREWTAESENITEFLHDVATVSSNDRSRFGALLSPLVAELHVSGPFAPARECSPLRLKLVDLEGLGQNAGATTAGSMTPQHYSWIDRADVVILVDTAVRPQSAECRDALEALVSTDNSHKLILAFTQVDRAIDGVVCLDVSDVVSRTSSTLENTLNALVQQRGLPATALSGLRRQIQQNTYHTSQESAPSHTEEGLAVLVHDLARLEADRRFRRTRLISRWRATPSRPRRVST